MFKKIVLWSLLVLVVIVALFAGFVAMQPGEFNISRKATFNATPEKVFAHVSDFHKWENWSPWAKLDPECKYTYDGPAAGKGSIITWAGNDEVGEGKMTILECKPGELIRIKLDFIKPFESSCNTVFNFQPEGDQTLVTWTMSGHHNFISKAMCLFMNMDQMVGKDFEKGLASMKSVVESAK